MWGEWRRGHYGYCTPKSLSSEAQHVSDYDHDHTPCQRCNQSHLRAAGGVKSSTNTTPLSSSLPAAQYKTRKWVEKFAKISHHYVSTRHLIGRRMADGNCKSTVKSFFRGKLEALPSPSCFGRRHRRRGKVQQQSVFPLDDPFSGRVATDNYD